MTKTHAYYVGTLSSTGRSLERTCIKCGKDITGINSRVSSNYVFWKKYWYWCLSCLQVESLLPSDD